MAMPTTAPVEMSLSFFSRPGCEAFPPVELVDVAGSDEVGGCPSPSVVGSVVVVDSRGT